MKYLFNKNPVSIGPYLGLEGSEVDCIEHTPNLRKAALEKAVLFGGPLIREILESAPIAGDKKYIHVDTKVTLLMPGWIPAIPGWHTDGVPRLKGYKHPSMKQQFEDSENGIANRYHTCTIGVKNPTEFITDPLWLNVAENSNIYEQMNIDLGQRSDFITVRPHGCWITWDQWNIHRALQSTERGWRLLVRVVESDTDKPNNTNFIRGQTQVYVPENFGW